MRSCIYWALGWSGVLSRARQEGGPFTAEMIGITLTVYQLAVGAAPTNILTIGLAVATFLIPCL